ncbi:excinuclease ABC subunit A [Aggregatibacter actinomycetemcomitans]|uniref:excinuclease ABC subunit A n=1 Tax=Aggregatibacter actinomycetemcomitans TaxID=714 RepID=UPI0011D7CD46|nr:excinuclease ABC subunit A [Aggregatibacter actinomycetemcomitans]TYA49398.1 excinuclease ABC subunit A [Aggregatibacter actinomycetemcomitans]
MKLMTKLTLAVATVFTAACAPRDTTHHYDIQSVLNSPEAQRFLNPNVKLYFGKPAPGKVVVDNAVTNKKTNAANKSDEKACKRAFLSAVKQLQDKAQSSGATKVGNIVSYYKKNVYKSTTQYECHAGHLIAGVALKGDIVK